MKCFLCPKKCGVERSEIKGDGACHMPNQIKIAHYELFQFEEPCISTGKGSGAIFFSGCNLGCVFCQNYEISTLGKGKIVSKEEFIEIIKELENAGAENINFVSPMHYALQLVEVLKIYKPKVPVIYNTNGYENESVIEMLAPYVDVFLPDFKYCSSKLSGMLSSVPDYFDVALKAIKKMRELKQDVFDDNGKILQGVIIRHMILPLCTDDSIKILETIKEQIPNARVSLMAQYTPYARAKEFKFLNRKITKREYDKVLGVYNELGLDGYVQELESATEDYIPNFKFV